MTKNTISAPEPWNQSQNLKKWLRLPKIISAPPVPALQHTAGKLPHGGPTPTPASWCWGRWAASGSWSSWAPGTRPSQPWWRRGPADTSYLPNQSINTPIQARSTVVWGRYFTPDNSINQGQDLVGGRGRYFIPDVKRERQINQYGKYSRRHSGLAQRIRHK